jgi:16S rRNA (guanine527-N7)-methyltransferase
LETLVAAAEALGVTLDARQQSLFFRYFELLEEGGEVANLTAARGWERVREELFVRSLRLLTAAPGGGGGYASVARWFDPLSVGGPRVRRVRVMDIGTGAGVPGLVLKIAVPEMEVTLLDSNRKKCDFLRRAVAELALPGVSIVQTRAEEAAHELSASGHRVHREQYDLVVARAVARLAELAELTLPFARVGGAVIAVKGADITSEMDEAAYAAEQMGAAPAIARPVASPGSAPADTIVYWLKICPTPARYPRRAGVPHKSPLLPEQRGPGYTAARPGTRSEPAGTRR